MREVEKHAEEDVASEMPIYEIFDPEGNELAPSPAMMPSSMASAVSSNTGKKDRRMPHNEKAYRANQYDYLPMLIPLEDRYSAGPSSRAHTRDTQVQYMNTQDLTGCSKVQGATNLIATCRYVLLYIVQGNSVNPKTAVVQYQ